MALRDLTDKDRIESLTASFVLADSLKTWSSSKLKDLANKLYDRSMERAREEEKNGEKGV